jgi:hypothetical protein
MSFAGKCRRKYAVDGRCLTPQSAPTRTGDLEKASAFAGAKRAGRVTACSKSESASARYDNHQQAAPALVANSLVVARARCAHRVELDCVLSIAKVAVPRPQYAVTIKFMEFLFIQVFGGKSSKEIERKTEKTMVARTFVILSRLLLVGAALCGGIGLAGAQNTTNPPFIPQTTVHAPAQSRSASAGALPQKMKRTTNEERRAAAARHADRRAAQLRKHHGQVK